jgi:hypothetical protein
MPAPSPPLGRECPRADHRPHRPLGSNPSSPPPRARRHAPQHHRHGHRTSSPPPTSRAGRSTSLCRRARRRCPARRTGSRPAPRAGRSRRCFCAGRTRTRPCSSSTGCGSTTRTPTTQVFLGGACVGACDSLESRARSAEHALRRRGDGRRDCRCGPSAARARPPARVALEGGLLRHRAGPRSRPRASAGRPPTPFGRAGRAHRQRPREQLRSTATNVGAAARPHGERTALAVGTTVRWFHGVYGDAGRPLHQRSRQRGARGATCSRRDLCRC